MTTTAQQIQAAQQRLNQAQAAFVAANRPSLGERRTLVQDIHNAKQALDKLTRNGALQ